MSKENYRTLNGLYKALEPIVKNLAGGYQIEKNEEDISIFCNTYELEPVGGIAIIHLLPVLKRANWMVRASYYEKRVELLVWLCDDI